MGCNESKKEMKLFGVGSECLREKKGIKLVNKKECRVRNGLAKRRS